MFGTKHKCLFPTGNIPAHFKCRKNDTKPVEIMKTKGVCCRCQRLLLCKPRGGGLVLGQGCNFHFYQKQIKISYKRKETEKLKRIAMSFQAGKAEANATNYLTHSWEETRQRILWMHLTLVTIVTSGKGWASILCNYCNFVTTTHMTVWSVWVILAMPFIKGYILNNVIQNIFQYLIRLKTRIHTSRKIRKMGALDCVCWVLFRAWVNPSEAMPSVLEYICYALCGLRIKALTLN